MRSVPLKAFLSCSFEPSDKDIVDYFTSICKGLDIQCDNVNKGYTVTPPAKAREMIADVQALIAVATKRTTTTTGKNLMPAAVEEEMAMAYAHSKPILLFVENDVDTTAGFTQSYGTFLRFDRTNLYTPLFLENALHSIHELKCSVLCSHDIDCHQQGQENLFAENTSMLADLVETSSGHFTWQYSLTKRLLFTSKFNEYLKTAAWAGVPVHALSTAPNIKWSLNVNQSSKPFILTPSVESDSPTKCEIALKIDPVPESQDILDYSVYFESPYLSPLFEDDIAEKRTGVTINGKFFLTYEGIVPIVRAKLLCFQIRIPRKYAAACQDIKPFVGSYTTKPDYLVPSEMKRMQINTEDFGGTKVITLTIESPLLCHVYGVAWNPPKGKTL